MRHLWDTLYARPQKESGNSVRSVVKSYLVSLPASVVRIGSNREYAPAIKCLKTKFSNGCHGKVILRVARDWRDQEGRAARRVVEDVGVEFASSSPNENRISRSGVTRDSRFAKNARDT